MGVRIKDISEKLSRFFSSDAFIVLSAGIVFFGWFFRLWVPFLCVFAALVTAALFLTDTNRPMILFLLLFTFGISESRHGLAPYWRLLFLFVPLFAGMICQAVRYRKKRPAFKPREMGKHHFFLLLFTLPFLFGGLGRTAESPTVRFLAFLLILLAGGTYTLFIATNAGREDGHALPDHVLKGLVAVGVVISLELLVYYFRLGSKDLVLRAIADKQHELGWGGPNIIATIYMLTIPAAFYFCTKRSPWTPLFTFFAVGQYLLLLSTGSRGCIFVVTFALPALLLYVMHVAEDKRAFAFSLCGIYFAAFIILLFSADKVIPALANRLAMGLDANGRLDFEYPEAWAAFRQYPLFGVGWDYKMEGSYIPLWYHSTVLQVSAAMGIFGLLFYALWTFFRYRDFYLARKDMRVRFLFLSALFFDAYCMIDPGFFSPSFFMMLLMVQLAVEVAAKKEGSPPHPKRGIMQKAFLCVMMGNSLFAARALQPCEGVR